MYNDKIFEFNTKEDITAFLFSNAEEKYRDFTSKLTPNLERENIIGVRVPIIRKLSKQIKNTSVSKDFLHTLPHTYLEENHLHGFLVEQCTDFEKTLSLLETFLPFIDNWATCDTVRPKIFKKHTDELYEKIKCWISSSHTYTIRYAIGLLNSFYLDEHYKLEHLSLVSQIKSDEYYVNMMIAWYFCTALSKQYDDAVKILENAILDKWVHNKTIQKACESFRIDDNKKAYLRTLKIK